MQHTIDPKLRFQITREIAMIDERRDAKEYQENFKFEDDSDNMLINKLEESIATRSISPAKS